MVAFVSDDFSGAGLDTGLWTVVDPVGDGEVSTDGSRLLLTVPAGTRHDAWTTNTALRAMQPAADTDFELEVKFESAVSSRYQSNGVLVAGSAGNYLRFDFFTDGDYTRVFAASLTPAIVRSNTIIGSPNLSPPSWMRVTRTGDTWSAAYSLDGVTFTTYSTFTRPLAVSAVGPFAGNFDPNPEHTTIVDYFFNTAAPITPEDGGGVQNVYIGEQQVQAMYVGTDQVVRAYLGDTLVFGNAP